MANKDNYDYPEDTQETQQTFGMGTKMGRTETIGSQLAMLKDPRILGSLVGFMLFSYLVSHLLAFLFGGNEEPKKDNVVAKTAVVAKRQKQKSLAEQLQAQQQKDVQKQQAMSQKMDSMHNQSASNVLEIKKVANKVHHIEDSMAELSNNIQDLHYEISLLTDQLKALKTHKTKAPAKKKVVVKPKPKVTKKMPLQHFHVRAIIHGRAWLGSKRQPHITVKVGDKLPTYGVVTAIMPDVGIVKTRSGRIITFANAND